MRQLRLILCSAAAAGLVVACVTPAAFAQEALKVAVINVVQLLEESEPGRQGIDALKVLQKEKTDERNAMQTEAQDLRAKITEGQFSLTEEKLAELQKELEDRLIELQRFNDDANRELQKRQEEMLQDIQGKVMPIINAVGQEGGYTMIFNKFESGLVYANEAIDITAEVMQRLNSSVSEAAAPAESGS
ncbi:MAG: OmpH family outer membrane protein [bacterium]|nr:OmpH family outer membrane protein [bacterium]